MTERPAFLDIDPVPLKFGTSGLRGRVVDMTDLEVYLNTQGFLQYLAEEGRISTPTTVLLGRDLRDRDPVSGQSSSPRIAAAVARAIADLGHDVIDAGTVPTPALAAHALAGGPNGGPPLPAVMVTGSHIPADRNGVKFYQPSGEVLKADEAGILAAVTKVRAGLYGESRADSIFGPEGQLKTSAQLKAADDRTTRFYLDRYLVPFANSEPLSGLRVVVYQHSSVARDILVDVLSGLGADVLTVHRVDEFVSVDTEDVTVEDEARYRAWVLKYGADALLSTDGDGDRPLIVDERGQFHRGDVIGTMCAELLGATVAAVPVSATDAVERHLTDQTIERTRIGSPYVIDAMNAAVARGAQRVMGWEANGGFLTATPFELNGQPVSPLPTRDAVLPIITVLLAATRERQPLSVLAGRLPQRATRAGLLDDFAPNRSKALLAYVRPDDPAVTGLRFDPPATKTSDSDWKTVDDAQLASICTVIANYLATPLGLGRPVEMKPGGWSSDPLRRRVDRAPASVW